MLKDKKILLGISGGIAAYKIPLLVRMLRKSSAEVKVVLTPNALHFVTPLVLETLSNNAVYTDVFAHENNRNTEHISITDWADMMLVAPATADVLAKMAYGIADDALTTTFCAFDKPVLIAPAMNSKMLAHPATQEAMKRLDSFENVTMLPCAEGELACGSEGKGRMIEVEELYFAIQKALEIQSLKGKKILITAGATQEEIDPVRYISNHSTGKMGYALAKVCALKGADVTLVSGPSQCSLCSLACVDLQKVQSADEMYEAVEKCWSEMDVVIFCAAVADYMPLKKEEQKIKKTGENWSLELVKTRDIASKFGKQKRENQLFIGFALETENEEENAVKKLKDKNLDYIVLNSLQDKGSGFGGDTNKVTIFAKNGDSKHFDLLSKEDVAKEIIMYTMAC